MSLIQLNKRYLKYMYLLYLKHLTMTLIHIKPNKGVNLTATARRFFKGPVPLKVKWFCKVGCFACLRQVTPDDRCQNLEGCIVNHSENDRIKKDTLEEK